jgi:hypothetical protein
MANVTLNLTIPTPTMSAAWHQRLVVLSAALAAGAVAVTSHGPGFGLPAADAVYVSSGVTAVTTLLRAITGSDTPAS